ncbi:Uu.00g075790.m01.CDS01 [Anthostomella pinea]|uniref:Uu.00g075790.m01.CDS01 n=1 Tax=Anthostomella pinea TaxID=933095 RepID=A0AAI8VWG6_9PEZI|nr:Uu.00g075790.m01.CDS01 [Anthostomella pinea]
MAARLEFSIDALRYPVDVDQQANDTQSEVTTALPTADTDTDVPEGYLPEDYKIFAVLRDFLQPETGITLQKAVETTLHIFPDGQTDHMRPVNTVCLELGRQIPYHHPSQLKLARFLWLFCRISDRLKKSSHEDPAVAHHTFYQHLQEDLADNEFEPGDDGSALAEYVNYQAFLANLTDMTLYLPRSCFATRPLRDAFAGDHGEGVSVHEAWIMGAAMWILYCGQALFKQILYPENVDDGEITGDEWRSWKEGFERVADGDGEGVGRECRGLAERAAVMMDGIERGMSF